jgi:predicted Rossmann-fold nucleotide-binding protein
MISLADGFIVLDGSIGTLTELVMAWNVAYVDRLGGRPARPVVAVGARWTDTVPRLSAQVATDGDLVACVPTVDEAVDLIRAAVTPRP